MWAPAPACEAEDVVVLLQTAQDNLIMESGRLITMEVSHPHTESRVDQLLNKIV